MGEVLAIKRVANVRLGKMVQPTPATGADVEAEYLRAAHVQPAGRLVEVAEKVMWFSSEELRGLNLTTGDVVVVEGGAGFGRSAHIDSPLDGWGYQNSIVRVRPRPGLSEGRFLNYVFQSLLSTGETALSASVATIPHYTAEKVGATRHWIPSVKTQNLIADFLDRETAQIDAMVDAQDRLISSLAERRATLIHTLVTKGLTESVEMRDSGSQWLGDVPAHWSVENIRRQAQMRTGHTPSRSVPEFWEECDVPWMTLADVWQLRPGRIEYVSETDEMVSRLGIANSAAELLPSGTVMLSRTASVGFSGIMSQPMATSQDFWNWVCRPTMLPEYLLYTFRAMHQEFEALRRGSTHQTIYKPVAAGFIVPVPPLSEQREIVSRIRRSLQAMDEMSDAATEVVRLLRERREALISAAVTGRIDPTTGIERIDQTTEKEAS